MKKFTGNVETRPRTSGTDFKGYFVPESITEAVGVLAKHGVDLEILAGGTDLLVDNYQQLYQINCWLDLKEISEIKNIKIKDNKIEIGAMVTHRELVESEEINQYFPLLSRAAAEVGSPQIRNQGTIGGNIVTASPAGDLLPPLLAYQAELELVDKNSSKRVAAEDFFVGPKETIIQPDQLLTKIIIPLPKDETRGSWIKVGKRKALAISTICLALVVKLDEAEKIKDIRACLGAVAPTPLEVKEIRKKIVGKKLSELDFTEVGTIAAENISPIDDIRGTREYRNDVAKNLVIRALRQLSSGGEGSADNPDS